VGSAAYDADVSSQLTQADDGPLQGWDADEQLKRYLMAARAPNTLKAYRSDWAEFDAWCVHFGLVSLPATPETLARYLVELAEVARTSTVSRRISSVAQAHRAVGMPSPSDDPRLKAVWVGIRRVHGTAPEQAAPLTVPLLRLVIDKLPPDLAGTRDLALLLIGFAGALRRSELVALDVDDVSQAVDGLVITKRRSKTDQEAAGELIGIPYGSNPSTCPVRSFDAWCQAARLADGPLFRPLDRHGHLGAGRLSAAGANLIVQRAVIRAGLPAGRYSGPGLHPPGVALHRQCCGAGGPVIISRPFPAADIAVRASRRAA